MPADPAAPPALPAASASPLSVFNVAWTFVAGMLVMLALGLVSMSVLMGLRSFGYGENLWAKNAKRATFQLLRYTQTGDPADLAALDAAVVRQQHFRRAREAMQRHPPDHPMFSREILAAGAMAEDVPRAIWLHRYFGWVPEFDALFADWAAADGLMDQLPQLRQEALAAHTIWPTHTLSLRRVADTVTDIDLKAAPLQQSFSETLARNAERTYRALVAGEVLLASLLILAVLWRTRLLLHDRQRAERSLAAERQRAAVTLAAIGDAVISVDSEARVVFMNEAARELVRAHAEPGQQLSELVQLVRSGDAGGTPLVSQEMLQGQRSSEQGAEGHRLLRADGSLVDVSWVATPIREGGNTRGAVLVLRDTTRERKLIERLSWLAAHDPLTKLLNRREFEQRLQRALDGLRQRNERGEPHRATDQQHVLMFIDLDQFKIVNDTCGHSAGDELLRLVTTRLSGCLRAVDTLARMGGDEFGLLLVNCPPEVGEQKAEELRQAIANVALEWGNRHFSTTASIGIVHLDGSATDMADVLSAADVACYGAKDGGRNRVVVFQHDDAHMVTRFGQMHWAQQLQAALRDGRFCLHAQRVVGLQPHSADEDRVELLVRLQGDDGKWVAPGLFLPAAERFGLMPQVDRWVLDNALTEIGRRVRAGEVSPRAVFSINLSGSSFGEPGFLADLKRLFVDHGVPHHHICFEITETQAVENMAHATTVIQEMRALGCSFALDDFGAGMSSFAYLKHLKVDLLKIDGTLVKDMVADAADRSMVETIQRLASALGMRTVGEYAETKAIVDALQSCGVDMAQGYHFSRPEPFLLAHARAVPAPAEAATEAAQRWALTPPPGAVAPRPAAASPAPPTSPGSLRESAAAEAGATPVDGHQPAATQLG